MDAKLSTSRRSGAKTVQQKRWSMSSQRLEQIVAEVMKPIRDLNASFNLDQSALLEEYLTEAGLHALDQEDGAEGAAPNVNVNFAELALLLQYSAFAYGRKVDLLYLNVLNYSQSLNNSSSGDGDEGAGAEAGAAAAAGAEAGAGARRRRRATGGPAEFEEISLERCPAATRSAPPRPPPSLPRAHLELEPRTLTAADVQLADFHGEPIGLFSDFNALWRLQDGMLVEDLAEWQRGGPPPPPPLLQLQAALQAAAPPPPAPRAASPPCSGSDSEHEIVSDGLLEVPSTIPLQISTPTDGPEQRPLKKRRCEFGLPKHIQMRITAEMQGAGGEFSLPRRWLRRVVARRRDDILQRRAALAGDAEFRGFDQMPVDIAGFVGFTAAEGAAAEDVHGRRQQQWLRLVRQQRQSSRLFSDDDGFFDWSSADTDGAAATATPTAAGDSADAARKAEMEQWQRRVVGAAGCSEARGLDMRGLARQLLHALERGEQQACVCAAPVANVSTDSGVSLGGDLSALDVSTSTSAGGRQPARDAVPCAALYAEASSDPSDLPGLFLATLFLANSENVEIVPGAPLTVDSFSVRLLTPAAHGLVTADFDELTFQ